MYWRAKPSCREDERTEIVLLIFRLMINEIRITVITTYKKYDRNIRIKVEFLILLLPSIILLKNTFYFFDQEHKFSILQTGITAACSAHLAFLSFRALTRLLTTVFIQISTQIFDNHHFAS